MIDLSHRKGQSIGVFGLGKNGRAAAEALIASGVTVYADDDNREAAPVAGATMLAYGDWPWSELACAIVSPGVPLTHPAPHGVVKAAQAAGVTITGDIELLCEATPNVRKIGITGTNGKSTTTALIAHILREAGREIVEGGNLGPPALGLPMLGKDGVYVIELSSYQLDLIESARFHIGVWMNLTPDHLDRHGDMEGYARAKARLFRNQQPGDTAIIGIDDAPSREMAGQLPEPVTISNLAHADIRWLAGDLIIGGRKLSVPQTQALLGRHNGQNIAAAYAACHALGLDDGAILAGIASFPGLPHRMQAVGEVGGVRFVNDSKATNADAARPALTTFEHIYWIAGGIPKAGGIATLKHCKPRISKVYLIGQAAGEFAAELNAWGLPHRVSGTVEQAVRDAYEDARLQKQSGPVVLLSPACASFDQYANFEQRGDAFAAAVNQLGAHGTTKAS